GVGDEARDHEADAGDHQEHRVQEVRDRRLAAPDVLPEAPQMPDPLMADDHDADDGAEDHERQRAQDAELAPHRDENGDFCEGEGQQEDECDYQGHDNMAALRLVDSPSKAYV